MKVAITVVSDCLHADPTNRLPAGRRPAKALVARALATLALVALAVAALPSAAWANPANMVVNGSFETFAPVNANSCTPAQTITNTDLSGWSTTSGYSFVLTTSNYSAFCGDAGNLGLYGPITASPDGGNFVASDGAYQTGYIYQTIGGLVPGASYLISFDWAAAQQSGYTGATTDYLQLGLGATYGAGASAVTPTYNLPSGAFSGWMGAQFNLVATAASEVLWFFAVGTPSGQPPFALLDGVTMTVAEPPAVAMLLFGLLCLAGVRLGYRPRPQRSTEG